MESFGGLGDCLQKSTIPRMLTEQGHQVYLNPTWDGEENPTGGHIHNPEIKRLIWEMNPHLRGFTDEPPTIVRRGSPTNLHNDFIKNWESFYGLPATNSYPEIYYQHRQVQGIEAVLDLSWLSGCYTPETVRSMASRIIALEPSLQWKQILSTYQANNVELDVEKIRCDTIFDLADVLASASMIVTLSSGSHMLAGAIHKGTIRQVCIMPDYLPPFPHYRLPGVQYEYPEGHRDH